MSLNTVYRDQLLLLFISTAWNNFTYHRLKTVLPKFINLKRFDKDNYLTFGILKNKLILKQESRRIRTHSKYFNAIEIISMAWDRNRYSFWSYLSICTLFYRLLIQIILRRYLYVRVYLSNYFYINCNYKNIIYIFFFLLHLLVIISNMSKKHGNNEIWN